jgi:hypothetical protein
MACPLVMGPEAADNLLMLEKIFAALGLAACIAMALQMMLPPTLVLRWRARLLAWWRDPFGSRARAHARAAAEAAIQQARRAPRGRWKGNVYKLGDQGEKGDDGDEGDGDDGDGGQDRRTLH